MLTAWRQVPEGTRALIVGFEGLVKTGYADSAGIATAGIGHTGPDVRIGVPYTDEQIEMWYKYDETKAVQTIYKFLPASIVNSLPNNSFMALISFIFNVGPQAFVDVRTGKSTNFRKTILSGSYNMVGTRMKDWNKARVAGRLISIPGLTIRRATEASLWSAGFAERPPVQKPDATPVIAAFADVPVPEMPDNGSDAGMVEDEQQVLPVPVPQSLGGQGGVIPAPPQTPPANKSSIVAGVSATVGAVSSIGPELFTENGQQLLYLRDYLPIFGTIGGILVLIGAGIMMWQAYKAHKERGA